MRTVVNKKNTCLQRAIRAGKIETCFALSTFGESPLSHLPTSRLTWYRTNDCDQKMQSCHYVHWVHR